MVKKLSEPDTVEEAFVRLNDYAKVHGLACPFTVELIDHKIVTRSQEPFVLKISSNQQPATA
ncbi:MAG: hypothetical protein V1765_02595 [bacterium]